MKNLTRVLALVLVLCMAMSSVAFASFTDVETNDDYAEAINTLAALGIIKGYEDGTFGADKAITRAEAVAIVNRIQGYETAAAGAAGASLYTDVPATHWAVGDINFATQMGIISGDGNGLFRPEDQVSYQEMVKMLVCALNYGPAVAEKGGWPTGYLVLAQENDVLDNTTNGGATAANRGVVAQLTFNALTAPMMEQKGYGDDKSYEFADKAGERKTLLSSKLKMYKVSGDVVANSITALKSSTTKPEEFKLDVKGFDPKSRTNDDAFYGVALPFTVKADDVLTFLHGETGVQNLLGYKVAVYVTKNADKEWATLAYAIEEGTNKEVAISAEDIYSVTAGKEIVTKDENGKKEEYEISASTVFIKNGEKYTGTVNASTFCYEGTAIALETPITLVYSDKKDDVVDYIFFDEYMVDRVKDDPFDGVTVEMERDTLNLDVEDNKDLVFSITLDGKAIEVKDLKEGDIVTYKKDSKGNYYELLVSRETVEGEVEATVVDTVTTPEVLGKEFTIAGKDYKVSAAANVNKFIDKNNLKNLTSGNAGTFYLDAFGKLAYFVKGSVASADKNYAVVVKEKTESDKWDDIWYVQLLGLDGKMTQYQLAEKITIYQNSKGTDGVDSKDLFDASVDPFDAKYTATIKKVLDDAIASKILIDYTLNTAGEINTITAWDETSAVAKAEDEIELAYNGSVTKVQLNERTGKLGNYVLTDNTVVFYVGDKDDDEWGVTDKSFFTEDVDYNIIVMNANSAKEVAAVVVTNEITSAAKKDNVAVFVKQSQVRNDDGVTVAQITFYKNGELKTILGDGKTVTGLDKLSVGDAFTYKTKTTGEVSEVEKVAFSMDLKYDANDATIDPSAGFAYVAGQVYDRSATSVKLAAFPSKGGTSDDWDTHVVPADANVYIVDYSGTKVTVKAATMMDLGYNRFNTKDVLYDEDVAANWAVMLKYVDGDVTDVIAYKNAYKQIWK